MTQESLQSKVITHLRFPLIVCVVFIHVIFMSYADARQNYPLFFCVDYWVSEVLARTAVPLFFFISGFLFFYRVENFSLRVYGQKVRKRFRTLAVPYLLWNVYALLIYFVLQTCFGGMAFKGNVSVADFRFSDFLGAFWDMRLAVPGWTDHTPVNYPLWFIRDLMMIVIFSPLIYGLVKFLRVYALAGLALLWILGWDFSMPGFSIVALFFFAFGTYFSVHKKQFVSIPPPHFVRFFFSVSGWRTGGGHMLGCRMGGLFS